MTEYNFSYDQDLRDFRRDDYYRKMGYDNYYRDMIALYGDLPDRPDTRADDDYVHYMESSKRRKLNSVFVSTVSPESFELVKPTIYVRRNYMMKHSFYDYFN